MERRNTANNRQRNPVQYTEHNSRKEDPTGNVKDLVYLATAGLRDYVTAEINRLDELEVERFKSLDEKIMKHEKYGRELQQKELAKIESDLHHSIELTKGQIARIDANREDDRAGVTLATDKAEKAAAALADRVASTANVNRDLVDGTASKIALQQVEQTTQMYAKIEQVASQINTKLDNFVSSTATRLGAVELAIENSKAKSSLSTPVLIAMAIGVGGILMKLVDKLFP